MLRECVKKQKKIMWRTCVFVFQGEYIDVTLGAAFGISTMAGMTVHM